MILTDAFLACVYVNVLEQANIGNQQRSLHAVQDGVDGGKWPREGRHRQM